MATSAVSARVQRLRWESGLTIRELAVPGLSYGHVNAIENGRRQPSEKTLRKLAERLGVTPLYLETGSDAGPCPHCEAR